MKTKKKSHLNMFMGLILALCLLVAASIINEVGSYYIKKDLHERFVTAAAKTTTLEELDHLFSDYTKQISKLITFKSLFKNTSVSLNLSAAYDENYEDDQQSRDRYSEPKINCSLLLEQLEEYKMMLDKYNEIYDMDPEERDKYYDFWEIMLSIPGIVHDYEAGLAVYGTKCLGLKIYVPNLAL